jgi:hypothetical protein
LLTYIFFNVLTEQVRLRLLYDVPQSYSDTPHSLGLLWTSDRPVAESSTLQHTTLTRDRHPSPRRNSNLQSQQAKVHRLTRKIARLPGSVVHLLRMEN